MEYVPVATFTSTSNFSIQVNDAKINLSGSKIRECYLFAKSANGQK